MRKNALIKLKPAQRTQIPTRQRPSPCLMATIRNSAGATQDGNRRPNQAEIKAEKEREEKAAFAKAADEIRSAVANDPSLADLTKQLAIDMTPEGMRIQIMDQDKLPMFTTGSATPNDRARALIQKVAAVLQKLPEAISIAGYTDATQYAGPGKSNWELSSDRANATRRLLTDSGLDDDRIRTVTGHADRDPLVPGDPLAAANRRIAIVVLRDTTAAPAADRTPAQPDQPPKPADRTAPPADRALPPADHASQPLNRATPAVWQSRQPTDRASPLADPAR